MAVTNASHIKVALTADATSGGLVTIADNSGFFVGATVTLKTGSKQAEYVVVVKVGTTQMRLRAIPVPGTPYAANYGYSDLTGHTLAGGATITQSPQSVIVPSLGRGLPSPTKDGQTLTSDSSQPGGVRWV